MGGQKAAHHTKMPVALNQLSPPSRNLFEATSAFAINQNMMLQYIIRADAGHLTERIHGLGHYELGNCRRYKRREEPQELDESKSKFQRCVALQLENCS